MNKAMKAAIAKFDQCAFESILSRNDAISEAIQAFLNAVDVKELANEIWDGRSPLELAEPDIQDAYIIRAKRVLIHLKAMTEKK